MTNVRNGLWTPSATSRNQPSRPNETSSGARLPSAYDRQAHTAHSAHRLCGPDQGPGHGAVAVGARRGDVALRQCYLSARTVRGVDARSGCGVSGGYLLCHCVFLAVGAAVSGLRSNDDPAPRLLLLTPPINPQALGDDVAEFQPRDPEWWHFLPAEVSCANFKECGQCAPDEPDAERRGGETRREFHDRLRAETLARPICEDVGA